MTVLFRTPCADGDVLRNPHAQPSGSDENSRHNAKVNPDVSTEAKSLGIGHLERSACPLEAAEASGLLIQDCLGSTVGMFCLDRVNSPQIPSNPHRLNSLLRKIHSGLKTTQVGSFRPGEWVRRLPNLLGGFI